MTEARNDVMGDGKTAGPGDMAVPVQAPGKAGPHAAHRPADQGARAGSAFERENSQT
jgi:hypothetical protein